MSARRKETPRGGIWEPSSQASKEPAPIRLHTPVLLQESVDALNPGPDAVVVDATLGEGGHAGEILRRLSDRGRVIGIECDSRMISTLAVADPRLIVVEGNFKDTARILKSLGHDHADGVLADLGISARHYQTPSWGFSFVDGPLDMRLGTEGPTAADILNDWPEHKLAEWFVQAGERRGRALAKAIAARRRESRIARTSDLVEIAKKALGRPRGRGSHPATKVFRAIREAVTGELEDLIAFIPSATDALRPGGRIAVLAYTWEEERIVRREADKLVKGCICPPDFPVCKCGRTSTLRWISRKGITPGEGEVRKNPSARSAKLLVVEHL